MRFGVIGTGAIGGYYGAKPRYNTYKTKKREVKNLSFVHPQGLEPWTP